ncbi:uracil phosphoribosyltransferase [Klebsormidium nitens]|uniref:uracil phosphoribosyltransferase n=1 Tax=Klebsormidium nitens TaxID=105231 RepID=A0A1Y1ITD2_KLENI|nr:uracil phosphoribosyltransferase [Klebsormidium nitens]|eukprot:GAQ92581.1 uracil phosphoribosyltransferase [Klebsormidium nitens]
MATSALKLQITAGACQWVNTWQTRSGDQYLKSTRPRTILNEKKFLGSGGKLSENVAREKVYQQQKRSLVRSRQSPSGAGQMLVYVPPHPLIKHWMAVLRNKDTPQPIFRSALAELGRCLIYEALRDWLPMIETQVETPCGVADVAFIDPTEPVKVVPILRAGLVLIENSTTLLPAMQTYHLGYARDERTLKPRLYLNKLPPSFPQDSRILLADPMLATGGTIVAAIEELRSRGADVRLMRVVSAVCAPPALKLLSERYPGLKVYTGIIDPDLNDYGFIVPGLGDAGDRSFGT